MTMRYDLDRKRIICRWEEPVKIVMDKKKGCIKRSRMITVKVNNNGKLNNKDIRRHEDHPMFPFISRFNSLLKTLHSSEDPTGHTCAVCDREHDVSPHYDAKSKSVIWLCRDHLNKSPKMDV